MVYDSIVAGLGQNYHNQETKVMIQISEDTEKRIRSKYSHLLQGNYESGAIRAIAAAEQLSDAINEMGFDAETFAKVLANDHRTLQQGTMRCMMAFVKLMAENYSNNFYDARNEASCKLASEIVKIDSYLPNI